MQFLIFHEGHCWCAHLGHVATPPDRGPILVLRPLGRFPLVIEFEPSGFVGKCPLDPDAEVVHAEIPGSRFPVEDFQDFQARKG